MMKGKMVMVMVMLMMLWGTVAIVANPALAQPADAAPDTLTAAVTDTIYVRDRLLATGEQVMVVDGDYVEQLPGEANAEFINKGSALTRDLYLDGFKRGDITISVDGERMTTACPNRMDVHLTRLNPLDVRQVEISRTGGSVQVGLGGLVRLDRRRPGEAFGIGAFLSGEFGRSKSLDGGLAMEGKGLRGSGRYRAAEAYLDGDGRSFSDLYNYAELPTQTFADLTLSAARGRSEATLGAQSARDQLTPYLQMDERETDFWSLGGSFRDNRLYVNSTRHLMDTGLRSDPVYKVTDVRNWNFGLTGARYELYGRNWDADNSIGPLPNDMILSSHMIPDVWRWGGGLRHGFWPRGPLQLNLRLGLVYTRAGDAAAVENATQSLYPDAKAEAWAVPFAVGVSKSGGDKTGYGLLAELSSAAPEAEQLYIALNRPGARPDWVGNPGLDDPLRATLRATLDHGPVALTLFGSHIWDYVYLVKRTAAGAPYQTYAGVDALLAGANLQLSWPYLILRAQWNWGEKTADSSPLAEIAPLIATLRLQTPELLHTRLWLLVEGAAEQSRIDLSLDETATPDWSRADLGLSMKSKNWQIDLRVVNLADATYYRHLSYLRDPFASGADIYEPGRTGRLTVVYRH